MTTSSEVKMFNTTETTFTHALPLRFWSWVVFILMTTVTVNACASNTMKWKEEVILHNGKTIVVSRTKALGGYPTRESRDRETLRMTITFTVPDTDKEITWESDFGRGNENNLNLMMLDFVNGMPYIAAYPAGCNAYNKWGRPNPFYIFFKYDGSWEQIPLNEFPKELKETNVVVGGPSAEERGSGYLTVARVKELNRDADKEYHTIVRTPIKTATTACEELIYYKGSWIMPGDGIARRFLDATKK